VSDLSWFRLRLFHLFLSLCTQWAHWWLTGIMYSCAMPASSAALWENGNVLSLWALLMDSQACRRCLPLFTICAFTLKCCEEKKWKIWVECTLLRVEKCNLLIKSVFWELKKKFTCAIASIIEIFSSSQIQCSENGKFGMKQKMANLTWNRKWHDFRWATKK